MSGRRPDRRRGWEPLPGRSAPSPVGETLERYLASLGAPPIRTLTSLESAWPEAVGPALADPTRPVELVDGVLVVACDDASWAAQIQWSEGQVIERLRSLLPDAEIRRLRTRVRG